MPKIDELKETLNTLRVVLTITIALIVALTSGLISRYDKDEIDIFLYIGIMINLILMSSIPIIIKKLIQKTKEIGEL